MATKTTTFYPSAYDEISPSSNYIDGGTNPVGKGSDNTTYASIKCILSDSYAFWPFDVSVIPRSATIDSVECKAKAKVSSPNVNATLQLFSGETAHGSETKFKSTNENVYSLTPGTWTRAELDSIRLKTRINSNVISSTSLSFFGADLTVTYTYQAEKFMLKLSGAWHDIARVFKKVNGIWVEQTELSSVVDTSKKLVNGGEIN